MIQKLKQLAEKHVSEGQGKYYRRIRAEDIPWNHKRIERVCQLLGLNKRKPERRRLPTRVNEPLQVPQRANDTWSMDFMHDSLTNDRKFRLINIIDDYNREAIRTEPYSSIGSKIVVKELSRLVLERGKPSCIRVDNGPEFIAENMQQWCRDNDIRLHFIQPDKPMQNAFIVRFNESLMSEVLDIFYFRNPNQVSFQCDSCMIITKTERIICKYGHQKVPSKCSGKWIFLGIRHKEYQ